MSKRNGGRTWPGCMPRWSDEETATLKWMHPDSPDWEIAAVLGRTVRSVRCKAARMGLRKSPERLMEMGAQNVRLRYAQ